MNLRTLPYKNTWAAASLVLLLAGCASFSRDGGFGTASDIAKDRLNKEVTWVKHDDDARRVDDTVRQLLAKPLSVDDAVQIALLNNRGLQATYASLGIAESDLVQAGRLPNPGFTFSRTHLGGEVKVERTYLIDFVRVLTTPLTLRIEGRRFEQAQLTVANEVIRMATETRKAYYEAVAAGQTVEYLGQVKTAAEASAELAAQMARAGSYNALQQAQEQAFYADTMAQLARATLQARAKREKLTRLMGLWGASTQFKLPERLPDLPKERPALRDIEPYAIAHRLDIQAARLDTQATASALGLTRTTRFINVLDLGYKHNTESNTPNENGYEISLEIPLFDWGGARVKKAESVYMQSANTLAQTAIDARSEVRENYAAYVTGYDIARHYRDEVVPLRKKISDEFLLRYNGMLASAFELLADARDQVTSVIGYVDALKDFWLAQADLEQAMGGRLPEPAVAGQASPKKEQ